MASSSRQTCLLRSLSTAMSYLVVHEYSSGIALHMMCLSSRNFWPSSSSWGWSATQAQRIVGWHHGHLPQLRSVPSWNVISSHSSCAFFTWMTARDTFQPGYDPLYKLRPFVDPLIANFQAAFTLGREVSVDEGMIGFKGLLWFVQYMPKKPTKWGMKAFVLADSVTGYTYNWRLYAG